jgi:protein arginine kinase activator
MFCDDCKHKPATVHLTQLVNGKKFDVHLCSECAAKKGFLLFDQDKKFSIPNFLGSFLGGGFNLQDMHSLTHDSRCQNCGMVFSDIKQTGKLGCSQCYKAFDTELEPTLRRIHGNSLLIPFFLVCLIIAIWSRAFPVPMATQEMASSATWTGRLVS